MPQVANQVRTVIVPRDSTPISNETFDRHVRDSLAGGPDLLRLDCHELEKVVSSHIRLLWDTRSICRLHGVVLQLANPTPALMRILRVLDLVDTFRYEGADHEKGQRLDRDLRIVDLPRSFSDNVRSTIEDVDDGIARFVAFLEDMRVSATTMIELRTAYYEIATNIRIHSGITAQDHFQVIANVESDHLTISFIDKGQPFDPTVANNCFDAVTASHHRQRRGFGLPMIHRLANHITYHRDMSSQNVLTVTKKWHS